ncbi:DNA repair protein RecO [Corynebacterium sp. zg254]|uniref:DNA repair protein RecO n=1 Tax=Corynebacterium zhongnanshanii TaxID=2768834 RepID=A0ABQ6VD92_9CORY|nr:MULTISPECIES: DNA repair protein RecO [Corynebacterium]KAB3520900.1 DNA repair protein RecO [Corynebacterium zhongnanshanii]MCR5914529.1 DNA repair protein RecO [Corynebacterium sp. zg254]
MATRPNYRDEAFIVRSYKLGEADMIFVLLTREHGVVRAVAQGVRKTKSRFGAHLDRFCRVNVHIYPSRRSALRATRGLSTGSGVGLGKITDAVSVENYAPGIIANTEAYYAASAVLEVALALSQEPDIARALFPLVDSALCTLSTLPAEAAPAPAEFPRLPAMSVADQFSLDAIQVAGWSPSLVDCAQCGRPGPHRAFHAQAGGAVCVTCRPPGSATPPPEAVRYLWLLQQHRDEVAAEVAQGDSTHSIARVAHSLLLGHIRSHVDEGLPALSAL